MPHERPATVYERKDKTANGPTYKSPILNPKHVVLVGTANVF